jgi:hypothetical protein
MTGTLQSEQRFISQCYVMPGHGVVNSSSNGTDAFNPNTDLPADEQAALSVLECPIGYYSAGGSVNNVATKCTQCPAGSSTTEPGRTSEADCNGERGFCCCCVCWCWCWCMLCCQLFAPAQQLPVMRTCARNGGCKGSVVPSSPQGKSAREQCCQQPAVSVI